ncbi:MAG: hypothetical protein CMJ58_03510 [Planctomycetaceae bacterium]|nr:hypothetical protein [Planctomycetaceae bacterium]
MKYYPRHRQKAFWASLLLLALPVVVFWPYGWFVFEYAHASIVTPEITDPEHRRVHLGVWFGGSWLALAAVTTSLGATLLAWSLGGREHRTLASRWSRIAWIVFSATAAVWIALAVFLAVAVAARRLDVAPWIARSAFVPAAILGGYVLWRMASRRNSQPRC